MIQANVNHTLFSKKYPSVRAAKAYIQQLYENSIWFDTAKRDSHKHYGDIFEEHLKNVLLDNNIDLKGHVYGRFSREINEFINAKDEKTRRVKLDSAAFNIRYDFGYDFPHTMDDLIGLVRGCLKMVGKASCLTACHKCGQELALVLCGDTITLQNPTCEPVGYYKTEVEFPTGKVITGDSIGEIHEYIQRNYKLPTDDTGMDNDASMRDISAMFARAGMYHVFVGNSCPGVYHDRTSGTVSIGNSGYDDNDNEVDPIAGTHLDTICTDLWWASIIDIKVFKKLLKQQYGWKKGSRIYKEAFTSDWAYDIIEIPPGKYVGTSYYHIDGYGDYDTKTLMATLEPVK